MRWRVLYNKTTIGILSGVAAGVGAKCIWQSKTGEETVLASWTTNFEPSVKWNSNWDRRDPDSLIRPMKDELDRERCSTEKKKAMATATRHLFLIRHGNYVMDGESDEEHVLTTLGRQQANILGKRMKELDLPFDVMINSTMERAKETADIIAKHLNHVARRECAMIREGAPIPPEPPVGHWKPEAQFYEDGARIEAAFRKYFHRADVKQIKDSYEIYVCHANVIRYFVCRAMQFPPEAWLRFSLHHCSVTWLTIRPNGRVVMRSVGDSGHLPRDLLSSG